jgi:hypothetical protein
VWCAVLPQVLALAPLHQPSLHVLAQTTLQDSLAREPEPVLPDWSLPTIRFRNPNRS